MTTPMTPEELKACRERAEKATEGPWEVSRRDDVMGGFDYFVEAGPLCVAVAAEDARPTRGMGANRDAVFIANARTDVPRLHATIDALEADLFRVADALGRVQYPDGHAPYRGSVEDMVSRAEELTRTEATRGDALAALREAEARAEKAESELADVIARISANRRTNADLAARGFGGDYGARAACLGELESTIRAGHHRGTAERERERQ